jgi:copper chaperone CopZ
MEIMRMEKTARLLRFQIEGMTCDHCVKTIKKALEKRKGIESADINLESGMAIVKVDSLQFQEIRDIIEKLGYSVKITSI